MKDHLILDNQLDFLDPFFNMFTLVSLTFARTFDYFNFAMYCTSSTYLEVGEYRHQYYVLPGKSKSNRS